MAKEYKLTNEQYESLTVTIDPPAVLSFPKIFEKGKYKGKETSYGGNFLIKKEAPTLKDDKNMAKYRKVLFQAKIFQWGQDQKKWPKGMNSPISDGDDSKYKEEHGHWILKATTNDDLVADGNVVNAKGQEILAAKEIYGGILCRAHLQAGAYEISESNLGVKFYLKALKKVAEGKKLGGGGKGRAKNAFEKFDDSAFDDSSDAENSGDDSEDDYEM